jgi:hypothetical protein
MKRKILIITYYWPPSGGSGVQRWVYFSKYLNQMDFEPIILTVDEKYASYPYLDDSLMEEVKQLTCYKTKSFEPLQIYSKLASGNKTKAIPYGDVETKNQGAFKKVAAFIRGNLILPDARKYWKRYALPKAKEIIREHKIESIITTGPPHSTHLIGLALKKTLGVKWLADFRDPWTEIFYNKDLFKTKLATKKDLKMEVDVLSHADLLTAVSPNSKKLIDKKIQDKSKSYCFYNGFEHTVFDKIKEKPHDFDLLFSYVGYIGKHHQHEVITEGLKDMTSQHTDKKIGFHLAGNVDEGLIATWRQIKGLTLIVEGVVSHERAVEISCNSSVVIVNIPNSSYALGNIPGKLLECLATELPLLLIAKKESDAASLINDFENTITIENDIKAFSDFSEKVMLKVIGKDHKRPAIMKYSRQSIARDINDLLKNEFYPC